MSNNIDPICEPVCCVTATEIYIYTYYLYFQIGTCARCHRIHIYGEILE